MIDDVSSSKTSLVVVVHHGRHLRYWRSQKRTTHRLRVRENERGGTRRLSISCISSLYDVLT